MMTEAKPVSNLLKSLKNLLLLHKYSPIKSMDFSSHLIKDHSDLGIEAHRIVQSIRQITRWSKQARNY